MRHARAKPITLAPTFPQLPVGHLGRFEDYAQDYAGSVDIIITDPPYSRKYLPLYEALGQFALTTLRPGGWLLCLTGWDTDFAVRQCWNAAGLEFITQVSYEMPEEPGRGTRSTSVGTLLWKQYHKPLLWYQKPGSPAHRRRGGSKDMIPARVVSMPDMDQDTRRWEQSLSGFQHIIRDWTTPSDVLCDPCMGWGTTLVAAISLERHHCIGIERDPDRYAHACQRLGFPPASGTLDAPGALGALGAS
jgi:site-specific DNA-methyltransferase (adenine-specific)